MRTISLIRKYSATCSNSSKIEEAEVQINVNHIELIEGPYTVEMENKMGCKYTVVMTSGTRIYSDYVPYIPQDEPTKVYIAESDITEMQRRCKL